MRSWLLFCVRWEPLEDFEQRKDIPYSRWKRFKMESGVTKPLEELEEPALGWVSWNNTTELPASVLIREMGNQETPPEGPSCNPGAGRPSVTLSAF